MNPYELQQFIENSKEKITKIIGKGICFNEVWPIVLNKNIEFRECNFTGVPVRFYNTTSSELENSEKYTLLLRNCKFEQTVELFDLNLKSLDIINCTFESLVLSSISVKFLYIYRNVRTISFDISDSTINEFKIISLKVEKSLIFLNTTVDQRFSIEDMEVNEMNIRQSIFLCGFNLQKSNIRQSRINDSQFQSLFLDSDKNGSYIFSNCHFQKNATIKIKNDNADIYLWDCDFTGQLIFNQSRLNALQINGSYFRNIVSFEFLTVLKNFHIVKSHFEKIAFFNDFTLENENELELYTIRVIKGQLQKAENQIDFLKYNALEKNKLLKSNKTSKTDKILLCLNKASNNFGTNWLKGIGFTFLCGLVTFMLIIIVNTICLYSDIDSEFDIYLDWNKPFIGFNKLISEFLKITFSLGFNYEEIKGNGFVYFIFILGKIAVGYGIYQTIAAFRKYK